MPGWQKMSDQPCDFYKMGLDNLIGAKGVAIINFPIDKVYNFLFTIGSIRMLDNTCVQEKCLFQEKDVQVMYFKFNSPIRDLIVSNRFEREPNSSKLYLAAKSCKYPYPEDKGVIRAEAYIVGYIVEKIDQTKTRVTYMTFADLKRSKGQISPATQKELSRHQGELPSRIEEAMKKYKFD